MDEGSVPAAEP